jgi:all-trans-retinol 13,14-reductase
MFIFQICFYLYMREQGVQSFFSDAEKAELAVRLPQEGSKNVTDFGSLRGNRVRLARNNVKGLGKLDIIVVGAGMGGLTVAAIMSLCGYKVLVLDQGEAAGGCLASGEEKGLECDYGCHSVGGNVGAISSPLRRIFDIITGGAVEWCPQHNSTDGIHTTAIIAGADGKREELHFYADQQKTIAALKKRFPGYQDERTIDRYFFYAGLTRWALIPWAFCKLFPTYYWRDFFGRICLAPASIIAAGTTRQKLETWTDNQELIGALSLLGGGAGATPSETSVLNQFTAETHTSGGLYYPKGGTVAIVMAACELIRRNKGLVLTNCKVSRFMFDDENDMGVHMAKTRTQKCWGVEVNGHTLYAPRIVSDAGVRTTFLELVPERHRERLGNIVHKLKHFGGIAIGTESHVLEKSEDGSFDLNDAVSEDTDTLVHLKKTGVAPSGCTVTLYVGFHEQDIEFPSKNVVVYPSFDHDSNRKSYKKKFEAPFPWVMMTSASAKDTSWNTRWPQRSVISLIIPAEYEWFADYQNLSPNDRPFEYEKFKEYLMERLLKVLWSEYPALKGKEKMVSVKTPLDINDRMGVKRGELFGVENTTEKLMQYHAQFSPQTEIEGLFITGKDVTIGGGIASSVWGGMLTVFAMSKKRMIEYGLACF